MSGTTSDSYEAGVGVMLNDGDANYDDIVAFGHVLVEAGGYDAKALLGYFEKPHKWEKEYRRWRQFGGTLDRKVIEKMETILDGPAEGDQDDIIWPA